MVKNVLENSVTEKAVLVFVIATLTLVWSPAWLQADSGKNDKSAIEDAQAKAQDALNKAKAEAEKSEIKSVEDAKKMASDRLAKGKEELGKKWNKLKEENAAKNADKADDKEDKENEGQGKSAKKNGKQLAKGQAGASEQQLVQENEAGGDTDSDGASTEAAALEKQNLVRRREMGYMMHRRYLDDNETHLKTMKAIGEKKGLKAKEQRKHIQRIAKLQRLLELAEDKEDAQTIERIEKLQEREIARHEKALVQLHKRAKQGE